MIKYIKLIDGNIEEAPYQKVAGETKIYGYNKPSNQQMLLKDGYLKYEGIYPIYMLQIVNGKIIENIPQAVDVEKTMFTKLEIRRAARAIGKENILNALLNENETFKADWTDAQEINLSDPVFIQAIQTLPNGSQLFNEIKEYLK